MFGNIKKRNKELKKNSVLNMKLPPYILAGIFNRDID